MKNKKTRLELLKELEELMAKRYENQTTSLRKIDIQGVNNDQPETKDVEISECNPDECDEFDCKLCGGLYLGDLTNSDFDVDKTLYGEVKNDSISSTKKDINYNDYNKSFDYKGLGNKLNSYTVKNSNKMSVKDFVIAFECLDMPASNEIHESDIYFDKKEGKQLLQLTIVPNHGRTYLDQFLRTGFVGKISLINTNPFKKGYEETVLTENGFVRSVDNCYLSNKHASYEEFPNEYDFKYTVTIEL